MMFFALRLGRRFPLDMTGALDSWDTQEWTGLLLKGTRIESQTTGTPTSI